MMDLQRQHILVVEDEPLISFDLEDALREAGATVTVVATEADALAKIVGTRFAAATVDYHLGGNTAEALCDALRERDIPYVITTGNSDLKPPPGCSTVIGKPIAATDLVRQLVSAARRDR